MHVFKKFRYHSLKDLAAAIGQSGFEIPLADEVGILGEPISVGSLTIPNRIVVHPMEGCDGTPDGKPGDLTVRRYDRFAAGGAGLLWFEATAVIHEGRANPRQLLLSDANLVHIKALRDRTVSLAADRYGADRKPFTVLQLTHSGRYSRPDSEPCPLAAAHNPFLDGKFRDTETRILSDDEIGELEDRFVDAAFRAAEAGFDAVDIKSCHGYLISELLTARTREGRYGGSFENRTRFLLNVIEKIGKRSSASLVAIRLNAYDGVPYPYGWGVDRNDHRRFDLSEPIRLVKLLVSKGVRLINISAGNPYHNPHIGRPYDNGPYIPPEHPLAGIERMLTISRDIQRAAPEAAVIATGLSWLREFGAHCAAGGIRDGWFSLAGFGRQSFAYPGFPDDILRTGRMERKKCCIACGKCSDIMRCGGMTGCVVRDASVYLPIFRTVCGGNKSRQVPGPAEHV